MKKYKVITIQYTRQCNLNCSFCYRERSGEEELHYDFWYDLIPYLSKLTGQVALGGGEPFSDCEFVKEFSKRAVRNGLIVNVTTNGRKLMELDVKELKSVLKNITIVNLSYDKEKIKNEKDEEKYLKLIRKIKRHTKVRVGANIIVSKKFFIRLEIFRIIKRIMANGGNRIFLLYPKKIRPIDILHYKSIYNLLGARFKNVYVDNLTKRILAENGYKWKKPCHYGGDVLSIDECGYIMGCSFDNKNRKLIKLKTPKDIMKMKNKKIKKRYECPHIGRP